MRRRRSPGQVVWRTVVGLLAVAAALAILVMVTPIANLVARPLVVRDVLRPADVIVVLGGGVYDDGSLRDGSLRRLVHAFKLYREGYAPVLLLSSGNPSPSGVSEAGAMSRDARILGVPESALIAEERSTRTSENARAVAELARKHGFTRLLVVTSPTHSRRAALAFRKVGLDVALVPTDGLQPEHLGLGRFTLFVVSLREYLGILFYKVRGWA